MIEHSSNSRTLELGRQMHALAAELYPICRSVTGPGVRQTLAHLAKIVPLKIFEVPSGTKTFDWEVPREWNIRDAYIKDASGRRIVDFQQLNLHVVGYSVPVHQSISWSELKPHLHFLADKPDWVPYRTSFSKDDWGFCLSYRQFLELEAREERSYEICIDSSLGDGSLTYAEAFIPGTTSDEVLISTHICHPSLANDNLSGISVATFLIQELLHRKTRYSYRFLYIPATFGAVTWLYQNREHVSPIKHGWVLTGVGDAGALTYKRSRRGNAEVDRAFACVLRDAGKPSTLVDFDPFGYDERQFCSPGFNLPMGCLMRTPNGRYPEYHTSADNLSFIHPESLGDAWSTCLQVIDLLEANERYINQQPFCEPRLAPRGLHTAFGMGDDARQIQKAISWVLNLCDGTHTLLDIAERTGLPFATIAQAAELLREHELLAPADPRPALCHSERSEESASPAHEILRCPQDENGAITIKSQLQTVLN
jgi:aminopeptidase-like protein